MKNIIKSILFPAILSFITAVSFFCVYQELELSFAVLTPIFIIFTANAVLFVIYEKLRIYNKNLFSTAIIIAILFAALVIVSRLVIAQGMENFPRFADWFFKTAPGVSFDFPYFLAALMTLYVPFISSTIFYFTNVRYNAFFVMLTCMTTFALYAKTFTEIPVIFPSLIIALFIFISIEKRWYNSTQNRALSYPKFITTGIVFVALSAYIAGLFPPAESTPYRQQFDDLISGGMTRIWNATAFTIDNQTSSSLNRNADEEYALLWVQSDHPLYLRRQVFDNWNGTGWQHSSEDRLNTTWLREFFYGYEREGELPRNTATIHILTSTPMYFLPVPANTFNVSYPRDERIIRTIRDEFFVEGGESVKQTIVYNAQYHYDPVSNGLHFTKDEFFFRITQPDYDIYLNSALELPDYPRRDEVRALAHEITADYETDYEKAFALEQFFYNGEFTYDLDFDPLSKDAAYFLFDSKTGTCSDFATAMTVMAREIGIPARYTEGYIAEEPGIYGGYVVRVRHSHAFPEVFINGHGWVIFEPTIPGAESSDGLSYFAILTILISTGILAVLTVLFLIFALPRIKEHRFRKFALNSPLEKQVQLFYNKIYSEFMKTHRLQARTLSSRDLDSFADAQYGINLCDLTENYDKVVYGSISATDCDFYKTYVSFCDAVKSRNN
jgi:transglutaminase-like putative cysteine protease